MILGVTGAFGCGKSAVLAAFAAHGWRTADADHLCHELYAEPEGPLARQFAARWGREVLTELEFLTGTLYPELSRKLDGLIADCRRAGEDGAFELPLLYEAGYGDKFDRVAAVWAAPEIRHARLREQRKFSEDEIRLREARQLPADAKLERADFGVINNDGLAELELQIGRLVRLLNGSVR